ncbi:MAG TPA: prepilin-type N-terminal cleavage/methylation domain-containing protein [Gemmatimonadales bacterium]|nr:prepilin-type N-terminal cleavage/methylation domain-containing protein [Gemmatimonadales bacterium]
MRTKRLGNERGMSLIEIMIAMTVFLIVLAGVMQAIGSQSKGFRRGGDEMGMLQNLRYGVDQLDQDIRVAGANVPARQPIVVFAGPNSFAFNADIVSNIAGDISAVYVDPDAPLGEVSAWTLASATAIPGSSPSFTYPLADYPLSGAETAIFWFTADPETSRTDDFMLVRRINARPEEVLMRNVLAPASGTFFRYYYLNAPVGVNATLDTVPTAWGALRHSAPQHGQLPDTGTVARIDLLRAVEVRYQVTNARSGSDERIRSTTALLAMPNSGVKKLTTCGDTPIFGNPVTAVWSPLLSPPAIDVTWAKSVDETSGEQDVIRYLVWRRLGGAGPWGDPYTSIAASGSATYSFPDPDVSSGSSYQYAVAAQDCTPALSPQSFSVTVPVP